MDLYYYNKLDDHLQIVSNVDYNLKQIKLIWRLLISFGNKLIYKLNLPKFKISPKCSLSRTFALKMLTQSQRKS